MNKVKAKCKAIFGKLIIFCYITMINWFQQQVEYYHKTKIS